MITQNKFSAWLKEELHESDDKKYRHRLMTEYPNQRDIFFEELSSYVQSAHEDAKKHLRDLFEITLDPFMTVPSFDPTEGYPKLLHMRTLKGYFGEIFAGLIAEHFSPFEETGWEVPAFLFRYHTVAFQELERSHQTAEKAKHVPGRTGDDCLAFQLNREGHIVRYLYCEAKCTSNGNMPKMVKLAYKKTDDSVPVDLPQIISILKNRDSPKSRQWMLAIQKLLFILRKQLPDSPTNPIERCDMISYVCGKSPTKGKRKAWLPVDKPREEYKAQRRLEVVEVHLPAVEVLIQKVYGKGDNMELEEAVDNEDVADCDVED